MSSENDETVQYKYPWQIAFIFVFNLIVGAGALTLPKAFAETGWILGLVALGVLGLMSYCTSTFMVEAMSIANAVLKCDSQNRERHISHTTNEDDNDAQGDDTKHSDDTEPIIKSVNIPDNSLYDIETKVEMGEMARMFFNKIALVLYYIVISLYLYGDLAIYAAAVPKSMATTVCGDPNIFEHDVTLPCKNVKNIRVIDMYRIMLVIFTATLGPFVFVNISKTKILQIITTLCRWLAFIAMITLALLRIGEKKERLHPKIFKFNKLPSFFGVAVYSFMCQHSLPSILTPVSNKKRINLVLLSDFIMTASFYSLLVLTAVFAFRENEIEDLYTLNFSSPEFLKYALELFPVFTLSTNFPIIGITLRENLKTLCLRKDRHYGLFLRRYMFPLLTIIPPIAIAYITYDVGMLVSVTGTYAGAIIQYIIPVMLVYYARIKIKSTLGVYENKHRSPFRRRFWIFFVVGWYTLCFVFVTVYMINSNR